jgi:hypothetical protein
MSNDFSIESLFASCMKAKDNEITLRFLKKDVKKHINSGYTRDGYIMGARYDKLSKGNKWAVYVEKAQTIDDIFNQCKDAENNEILVTLIDSAILDRLKNGYFKDDYQMKYRYDEQGKKWTVYLMDNRQSEIIAYIPLELKNNCNNVCKNAILSNYNSWKAVAAVEIVESKNDTGQSLTKTNGWPCENTKTKNICKNNLRHPEPEQKKHNTCFSKKRNNVWENQVCAWYQRVRNLDYNTWNQCNKCIADAIKEKREKLKLTRASRILQIKDNGKPDKDTLELGSISCGAPRWRFFGNSVFHYLDKDHIPIVCEPGKFFVYNVNKNAILVRLNPTTERTPHLTVPSAWRKIDRTDQPISNGKINSVPPLGTDKGNPPKPTPNTDSLFKSSNGNTYWIVADCDTYKENSILRGLNDMSEPAILKILA